MGADHCHGHLLWNEKDGNIDHLPILQALTDAQLKKLFQYALRIGNRFLFLNNPGGKIDIAEEILKKFDNHLTPDERAQVYFERGKSNRAMNDLPSARDDYQKARDIATSAELRALISVDLREVLFCSGDAEQLEREMTRAPDAQDAYSLCRRASDALLMQRAEEARGYYRQALDRARTEDERYVALWGLQASSWSDDLHRGYSAIELYRTQALAIRPESRPLTEALYQLHQQAGEHCLNGEYQEAIRLLQEYLDRARRIGWPLTTRHRVRFPIELAATQAVRLLLMSKEHENADTRRDDDRKALTLLVQFGLGGEAEKLFTEDSIMRFAQADTDRKWFQDFVLRRTRIPKQDDVRQMCTTLGIPLLDDADIERTVTPVIKSTIEWSKVEFSENKHPELLGMSWGILTKHAQHLSYSSMLEILSVLPLGHGMKAPSMCSEMGSWPWQMWKRSGFLAERKALFAVSKVAAGIINALGRTTIHEDWIWRQHIISLCLDLDHEGLIGNTVRNKIIEKVRKQLSAETRSKNERDLGQLDLVNLLHRLDPTDLQLKKAAATLLKLYQEIGRSSLLPFWLLVMANVSGMLDDKQLGELSEIAKHHIIQPHPSASDLAYLYGCLAKQTTSKKRLGGSQEINRIILQLGTIDPRALLNLLKLGTMPDRPVVITQAEQILKDGLQPSNTIERQRLTLNTLYFWLEEQKVPSVFSDYVLPQCIRLLSSENHLVRMDAISVISHAPKNIRAEFTHEAIEVVLAYFLNDSRWDIRAVGAAHLSALSTGTDLEELALHEAMRLQADPIAAVRRWSAIAVHELE